MENLQYMHSNMNAFKNAFMLLCIYCKFSIRIFDLTIGSFSINDGNSNDNATN